MKRGILTTGALFFGLLMGLLYIIQNYDIQSFEDIFTLSRFEETGSISLYEQSLFFTIFVLLQFWNMFNAKAYMSGRSAFHFKGCNSFLLIAALIFIGQILIVNLGGTMFSVYPLSLCDWIEITLLTSVVLIVGEVSRLFKKVLKR